MKITMTPDVVFSYWIFVWYLLYILHLIPYSPKLWLLIAILIMILEIIYIFIKGDKILLIAFIAPFILFKLMPFYTILNEPYQLKDFIFGLALFILYLLWLNYKNLNLFKIYSFDSIMQLPFVHYFYNRIKKIIKE